MIDDKQLTDLFKADSPLKWLSGEITQDRTSDLRNYLIYELDVEEIDPESFANTASREFFNKQTDQWHIEFYDFLNAQEALWRKGYTRYTSGTLRYKPIIRCKDGENYSPYDEQDRPQVFLPVSSEIEFPVVKPSIYANDRAKSFLENLGLSKPDICVQVVNDILACFEQDNLPESVNLKEYQEKINQINEALHLKDSPSFEHLKNGLKTLPWVWSENFVTGQSQFKNPSEIYSPIDDLCMYFENNQDIWFCSRKIDFGLLFIFMKTEVKIQCKGLERYKRMPYSEIELWSYHGWHGVGINCFDHHTNVDGLEFALDSIHIKKAIYIWNKISVPLSNFVKGEIKKATRQDFSNARIEKQYSIFGTLLTEKAWIPTIDGVFRKPSECCVDDLHSELDRDEKLIKKLGIFPSKKVIKSEAIDELRKVLNNQGIPTEIAEILFENKEAFTPEFLKEALKNFQEKNIKQKPSFPSKKSKNPERREGKVRERHVHAENKTYKIKERSVRTSRPYYDPKIWLKDLYTNDDNIMVCQMCKDAMPFRLKDGSYYFEAIQITDDYPKETHQLYLALCPLCGAMYQHLVKKDALMISEFLNYIVNGNDKLEIPLDLGKNGLRTISFVETHLCDAKIILKTDQKRK